MSCLEGAFAHAFLGALLEAGGLRQPSASASLEQQSCMQRIGAAHRQPWRRFESPSSPTELSHTFDPRKDFPRVGNHHWTSRLRKPFPECGNLGSKSFISTLKNGFLSRLSYVRLCCQVTLYCQNCGIAFFLAYFDWSQITRLGGNQSRNNEVRLSNVRLI